VLLPLQIVKEGDAVMVGLGKGFTVILYVAVTVQLLAFVPVTV